MKSLFNENYFKTGNYINYLSRADRYHKLSEEIYDLLNKIGYNDKKYKILDYGCAVGFLLDGLQKVGYSNLTGYDISDWALTKTKEKGHNIIESLTKKYDFDICFALDVLEHMTDYEVNNFFEFINSPIIVYRIPVSNNGGYSFVLDISNNDITHINCKEKEEWIDIFEKNGYHFNIKLNLTSIYESEGVMCGIIFKK